MELPGKKIKHISFGEGVIESYYDGKIKVSFSSGNTKIFQYPKAFEKFLSFIDRDDQKMLKQKLAETGQLLIGETVVNVIPEKKHEKLTMENMKTYKRPFNIEKDFQEIERVLSVAYSDLESMKGPMEKPKRPLNYSDKWNRGAYALRYFYAYIFEYINMFMDLLDMKMPEEELNILSIGCGAKIDAWALQEALKIQGIKKRVRYTGIDKEDWGRDGYCPVTESFIIDEPTFYNCTAGSFLTNQTNLDYDVYLFPKSIGDIFFFDSNGGDFCRIKKAFERNTISKKSFYIVSSMIRYDDENRDDITALEELIYCIENNGFKLSACYKNDLCDRFVIDPRNYVRYPEYPSSILKEVDRLTGYKPTFSRNRECYLICKFEKEREHDPQR